MILTVERFDWFVYGMEIFIVFIAAKASTMDYSFEARKMLEIEKGKNFLNNFNDVSEI